MQHNMKNFKLKTLLLSLISASLVIGGMSIGASYMVKGHDRPAEAATTTYRFATSTGSGKTWGTSSSTSVTRSTVTWSTTISNGGSYNSQNYAGQQFGTSSKSGSLKLTSKYAWGAESSATNYYGKTKITAIRLWLNNGSGSVSTYDVTIGGVACTKSGTVSKNSSAGSDYTKASKITYTPGSASSGVVVVNVASSSKAWYWCAIEIDCEAPASSSYTVTYNANGATSGTVPTDNTSYASGTSVTVKGNTGSLAKTGYTFSGWNTQADGNGTDRAVGSTFSITANTTLYAKWIAEGGGSDFTWDLSTNSYSSASASSVTWSHTYATMTNERNGDSHTAANNYLGGTYSSSRFYNGNLLTITPAANYTITSVEFTATTVGYASALAGSNWTNASASASTTTVTVTPTDTSSAFYANIGATCGFTAVKVYYAPLSTHIVTITGASTVYVGSTITLSASCDHSDAITWKSSNTSVATVSNAGVVSGQAAGSVTITATCADGAKATKTITVEIPTVQATGITFNPSSITMTCTRTTSFTATLTGGSGNYEKTIQWTSSNPSVIAKPANTVSGAAVSITPTQVLTQTTVTLTATVKSPGSATASITITVNPIQQATGMSFSPTSLSLYVGEQGSFTPTLTGGETGKVTTISWSSNNPSVIAAPSNSQSGSSISVTPGYVASQTVVRLTGTVLSPGSATGYIDITVKPTQQATSMTITPNAITTYGLETESFTPTLSGGGIGHATTIVWTSDNTNIIPAPSNSEAGNAVSITPNDPLVETEVTLTGTVNVTGGASASIVITVLPASSRPLPALAYTLDCWGYQSVRDDDSSTAMDEVTAANQYFKTGAEYVESVDSGTLYLGKMSYDSIKFSSSKANGYLDITLASSGQLKATKIVLRMRGYGTDSAHATISVNEASSGQTGYLVSSTLPTNDFTLVEVPCNEKNTIQTISITATNRLYLDYIEVWARPREASGMTFNPTSVTVESGTSTSFIPTLTGGTNGYEQTINWVSSNPSLIPSPKPTEEGENVIITAKEGILSNTNVTITGTVASPGSATATINVTITPYVPVDHYTATGTAYGVEGESKWNLSEVYLHAWRDAGETLEKDLIKGIDYKLNSHTPIRYTDDKLVTIYDALGFIEGEWTVTGEITMAMDETINFRDVTDTTGGQSYNTATNRLTVSKGHVTVNVTGSSADSGYGTSSTDNTTLHSGNSFTVSVDEGCHLISVRAYGNNGPSNGVHLHMLSWSNALSTDTSLLGQSKAIFTDKVSRSSQITRSINSATSTTCVIEGATYIWGLEVVYSLPNPGPDATDPGANSDDMVFNDANNTGVSVRTLGYYFAGGTGTSENPFQIKSPTHLRNLAKLQNSGVMPTGKYFSLMNSFNWSGEDMEPIGKDADHAFHGFFRGNCHTIQGLVVTSTYAYAGMFGYIYGGNAGRVTNLILSSPTINCRPTEANTDVRAGFLCGYIGGSVANIVSGIMVFAGNENSGSLIKRATITANANAVVDCTDGDSGTNCVIVGGRNSATSIGIVSFVASMNDIVISDGNIIAPKTGTSTQARFVNQSNFTYTYYRHSGNSGAVVKE